MLVSYFASTRKAFRCLQVTPEWGPLLRGATGASLSRKQTNFRLTGRTSSWLAGVGKTKFSGSAGKRLAPSFFVTAVMALAADVSEWSPR